MPRGHYARKPRTTAAKAGRNGHHLGLIPELIQREATVRAELKAALLGQMKRLGQELVTLQKVVESL